jgi:hypothetical protein
VSENYRPFIAVLTTRINQPITTIQKASPLNTGIATRPAMIPTIPNTKAIIQTICVGALNFIIFYFLLEMKYNILNIVCLAFNYLAKVT